MVRSGAAWVFRRYSDDPDLLRLEAAARAGRSGLWALPEAERVLSREWRASGATERPRAAPQGHAA
jgi:endonuclease YncB( thermonuclease family)